MFLSVPAEILYSRLSVECLVPEYSLRSSLPEYLDYYLQDAFVCFRGILQGYQFLDTFAGIFIKIINLKTLLSVPEVFIKTYTVQMLLLTEK